MDESVNGHLIKALRRDGLEIVCAKDIFPEGTADEVHFEHAAKQKWVLVANDEDHKVIGHRWLSEGKTFAGLIEWAPKKYEKETIGDLVRKFEALAERDEPFDSDYPIIHL
ncbi:MAG: hypothetical protein E2P02_27865 [Acidobacteria bacterium]|nr:MAG: hypothetical protein E2P02_27865 [Acidobacteriota bacterium]